MLEPQHLPVEQNEELKDRIVSRHLFEYAAQLFEIGRGKRVFVLRTQAWDAPPPGQPVARESQQRIVARVLDEDRPAAGAQQPPQLGGGGVDFDVMQDELSEHKIERGLRKPRSLQGRGHRFELILSLTGQALRPLAHHVDHSRTHVECGHVGLLLEQIQRKVTLPAAGIEDRSSSQTAGEIEQCELQAVGLPGLRQRIDIELAGQRIVELAFARPNGLGGGFRGAHLAAQSLMLLPSPRPEGEEGFASLQRVGSSDRTLRIFFASSANLVTDHLPFGEGLIAWHLLSRLALRGHTVVACADQAHLKERAPFELVLLPDAQRFESLSPYTRPYAIGRAFERRGGSGAFDIVHWLFPQQGEEVRLPRTTAPCRTVLGPLPFAWSTSDREHGLRAGDLVRAPLTPLLRRRYSREITRADVLLASLPEVQGVLPPADAARAHVVGFGIDATQYDVQPLPAVPRVTFVGRLIENKGIRTLYTAFRTLAAVRPDVELAFFGDGSLRSWLEQSRSRDGLQSRVHLPGVVPHREVGRVLAECSVLCLPSAGEPFGMVILEAMAAGRAVVAVNRGGPAHLLRDGEGGLLVPPGDPAALASALARVLDDPALMSAMGGHNRLKVERTLSWDAVLDDLEQIYRAPNDQRAIPPASDTAPRDPNGLPA